jgi:nicotinamide-nucleotide amidase
MAILETLAARAETVAVAESLTGGLLAATLVDVPGASAVFRGGFILYATDLKHRLGGVSRDLLHERGPVDPEVALSMAVGARNACAADWGLSTTGVAGPEPVGGLPAGIAYVACHGPLAYGATRRLRLSGDRPAIRRAVVGAALDLLAEHLAS